MAIYQLPSKRWKTNVWFAGKKVKTKTFSTKELAQRFEREEIRNLEFTDSGGITHKEYKYSELFELWFKNAQLFKRPTSLAKDIQMNRVYVHPIIGNLGTREINSTVLNQIIYSMKARELKISSINNVIQHFKAVLNWATREELIIKNPSMNYRQLKETRKEMKFWSEEEVTTFLRHTNLFYTGEKRWIHVFYLLLFTTGMRLGEALGLQWHQVDWNNDSIYICQMWGVLENKLIPSTKGKSDRRVPLQEQLKYELRQFKATHTGKFIFDSGTGVPVDANNLRTRFWNKDIQKAGLRRIRIHDARHTFATIFLSKTNDIQSLKVFLGHQSITTTQLYTHFVQSKISEYTKVMNWDFTHEANVISLRKA